MIFGNQSNCTNVTLMLTWYNLAYLILNLGFFTRTLVVLT
jgi:hypothetical protein